jgi:predicted DNA-binding WGR domain protein
MATLIKEVRLIKTEVGENANKFWNGFLYDDGTVKAEWGRVGYSGDSGEWQGGETYLTKKLKEKTKKGYSEQKTIGAVTASAGSGPVVKNSDLHSIAKAQLMKTSNPTLDRLIKRFVDANVHKITSSTQITYNSTTGLFATPLGIVTIDGLTEARDILANMAPLIRKESFGSQLDVLLGQYLRIIPQNIGMKKFNAKSVIPNDEAIQKQNDLIDSLESSYQATQSAPAAKPDGTKTAQEQVFKVDMDVLSDDRERKRLEHFFENTKKRQHGYDNVRVREIFKVTIADMATHFDKNLNPIKEVFHGTSQANCLSILKSGLKVSPPSTAAIAGKMFGNGIYGAINSTKSLGYTYGRWGQGNAGDAGWLFVCDFAMGKIHTTYGSCSQQRGHDSVWAKAGQSLHNDELIVYTNKQVNIKYLLECK